jgi:Tfp pilus assembly protein PilN
MAAAAFLLVAGLYYFRERGQIDADRRDLTQRASIVDPRLQAMKEFEALQNTAEERTAFLKRIDAKTDWKELMRSISFVIPPAAVFEEMRVDNGDAPRLTIRGFVTAASADEGSDDFNRFFNTLAALPYFKSVTMPHPASVSSIDSPPVKNVNASPDLRSKVSFEILCELP